MIKLHTINNIRGILVVICACRSYDLRGNKNYSLDLLKINDKY